MNTALKRVQTILRLRNQEEHPKLSKVLIKTVSIVKTREGNQMKIYHSRGVNKITSVRRQENLNLEIDNSTQGKMLCRSSLRGHRHINKTEPKQLMNIMEIQLLYHSQGL